MIRYLCPACGLRQPLNEATDTACCYCGESVQLPTALRFRYVCPRCGAEGPADAEGDCPSCAWPIGWKVPTKRRVRWRWWHVFVPPPPERRKENSGETLIRWYWWQQDAYISLALWATFFSLLLYLAFVMWLGWSSGWR